MSTPPPRTSAVTSWLWKAGRVGVSTIVLGILPRADPEPARRPLQKQLEPDADMRVRLPAAGEYTLTSWTRTCGDTCNTLHRPTGRCSATFLAVEGQVTPVEIRFPIGRDCTVTVSD